MNPVDQNQCRICLYSKSSIMISIFNNQDLNDIANKIKDLANIEISPEDGLPGKICSNCFNVLNRCVEFIELCKSSDTKLRALVTSQEEAVDLDNSFNYKKSPESYLDELYTEDNVVVNLSKNEEHTKNEYITEIKKSRKSVKQQCSICGKVMSSRFRLVAHLRAHSGERPFSCPHCSKAFTVKQYLKVHIRTHTGEKPHQCSVCGESFAHSSGLVAHKRKHTGQTPYPCTLCPKSFRTIGHLQYHTRRHTGEKNFECENCGRAFITRTHLKHHKMTHTGDRPYVCSVCGTRFTRASHIKRHTQRIHGTLKTVKDTIELKSSKKEIK